MSSERYVGYQHPGFEVRVTRESLHAFSLAIGVGSVEQDTPAPPTYMKVIEGENGSSRAIIEALEIQLHRVLHAEQAFEYHLPILADSVLHVERRVSDYYTRKNSTLEFLVIESCIRNEHKQLVGRSTQTLILRTI
ncbi:MaoC family dehydratase N-terminal domain-containing protein [Pseudomonas fluorescens]|nr:MaoC family dehydratase N-terminal domain-containing protein [Pseudomonas fluorescens]